MGGLAANDTADGDDGVAPLVTEQPLTTQGKFEAARNFMDGHIPDPNGLEDMKRPVAQGVGDF